MVEDLLPYLSARNYDLIMGHSLGAVTVMSLFPHLSQSHPTAVILVDPPFQQGAEKIAVKDAMFSTSCINIKDAGAYLAENPLWSREDSICRELGTRLADPNAVHGIYKVKSMCRLRSSCLSYLLATAKSTMELPSLFRKDIKRMESDCLNF